MDFPFVLNLDSGEPAYKQICTQIVAGISSGLLPPYMRLPSTNELAQTLGVSRGTVVKAYEELIGGGYVQGVIGAGSYVSKVVKYDSRTKMVENRGSAAVSETLEYASYSTFAKMLLNSNHTRVASSLANKSLYGAASPNMLPELKWKQVLKEQIELFSANEQKLDHLANDLSCREVLAQFLRSHKGLDCSAEQLLIFQGTHQPLGYVSRLLVEPGDYVVIENPSYSGARADFALCGANLISIDIDNNGMKVEDLSSLVRHKIKLLYCTPSYQDPTGTIMSMSRRKTLILWAKKNNVILVEDGFDSHYSYCPPLLPPLSALDPDGNIIYIFSFWKLFYPLNSLSVIVLPPSLLSLFKRAQSLVDISCSWIELRSLAAFIEQGHLDRYLKSSKTVYSRRRKELIEALSSELKTKISIPPQSGSFHLCVRFAPNFNSVEITNAASQADLEMVSSRNYYLRNPMPNEYLIPFTKLSSGSLKKKVMEFATALSGDSR